MPITLKSISLAGYKSFRELKDFSPGRLSVLVGGNGAGKSNFLSFFSLLHRMMAEPGELQLAVSEAGGASRLLHDGPKRTREIGASLSFGDASNSYCFQLALAADDTFSFGREEWALDLGGGWVKSESRSRPGGHRESRLTELAKTGNTGAETIRKTLRGCLAYQFHDTSFASGMRLKSSTGDGRHLRRDGANLAAFLHRLAHGDHGEREALARIQDAIRQVAPFFAQFVLEPENGHVLLAWRERGSDEVFSASQASDGFLRVVALFSLLCQPPSDLPALLLLDEPELGLHPQAIALLGALIRRASDSCQAMVATQSVSLVDEFSLDDVVVLGRPGRESTLRRLTEAEYESWLEEYSPGELWRKNVIEGGPSR